MPANSFISMANSKYSSNVVAIGRITLSSPSGGKASTRVTVTSTKRGIFFVANQKMAWSKVSFCNKAHIVPISVHKSWEQSESGSSLLAGGKLRNVITSHRETKLHLLFEITQLINGRAGIQTQAVWLQCLFFTSEWHCLLSKEKEQYLKSDEDQDRTEKGMKQPRRLIQRAVNWAKE